MTGNVSYQSDVFSSPFSNFTQSGPGDIPGNSKDGKLNINVIVIISRIIDLENLVVLNNAAFRGNTTIEHLSSVIQTMHHTDTVFGIESM